MRRQEEGERCENANINLENLFSPCYHQLMMLWGRRSTSNPFTRCLFGGLGWGKKAFQPDNFQIICVLIEVEIKVLVRVSHQFCSKQNSS